MELGITYNIAVSLFVQRFLVEFDKSEANPNNNLTMRRAGLSSHHLQHSIPIKTNLLPLRKELLNPLSKTNNNFLCYDPSWTFLFQVFLLQIKQVCCLPAILLNSSITTLALGNFQLKILIHKSHECTGPCHWG